jgi:UPF0755 protein
MNSAKKILLGLTLFFVIILGSAVYMVYQHVEFYNQKPSSDIMITVNQGDNIDSVLKNIDSHGLNPPLFSGLSARLVVDSANLKAGEFKFSTTQTVSEFLESIERGKEHVESFTFTIPEGFSIRNIDTRLSNLGYTDKGDLIKEAEDVDFYKAEYPFISDFGEVTSLEGFLFPDTYTIISDINARKIVNEMLRNFQIKALPVLEDADLSQNNVLQNKYEVLKLASMVQREAGIIDDMPDISSVFTNRIKIGMKLQSDATWFYKYPAENRFAMNLAEVGTPDEYNTYYVEGFPPTPISNPGTDAIYAALNPPDTNYLFFFAVPPDPESIFSETIEEHNSKLNRS